MHVVLNQKERLFQARVAGGHVTKAFALSKYKTPEAAKAAADDWASIMQVLHPPIERRGMAMHSNKSGLAGISFSWKSKGPEGSPQPTICISCGERRFSRSARKYGSAMAAIRDALKVRQQYGLPGAPAAKMRAAADRLVEFLRKGPQ